MEPQHSLLDPEVDKDHRARQLVDERMVSSQIYLHCIYTVCQIYLHMFTLFICL